MADFYDQFIVQHERNDSFIPLGDWHDFDATLRHKPDNNLTLLQVGCRTFVTATAARQHWCGGVTRDGGAPRPFAEALITLAEALCRKNGWTNWAGPLLPSDRDYQHNTILHLHSTIQDLRRDLTIERECVGSRNNIIEQRGKLIVERDATIKLQEKIIAERDATILTLRGQADHPNEPAEALDLEVPQSLRREINELRTRVAELEKKAG